MNKQSIQKLSLFLTGLELRISENSEYIKRISAVFKSGTKEYTAIIENAGSKLKINFNGNNETIEPSWLSARISRFAENYDSLVFTYEERGSTMIIEADNKNVKMRSGDSTTEPLTKQHNETSHIGNREYYIKVGQADDLLMEIGILSNEKKVKNDMIRKYNQIDHFVELISDMLKDIASKVDTVTVLDCACGKSYLTFVLNYYIKEVLKKQCYFIGLDYSNTVIEASKKMAKNLGYNNMEFRVTDIRDYTAKGNIDLLISLHACDTATDEALALAVRNNVKSMVVVPCCHRELLNQYSFQQFDNIIKHGVLKARMADILTDGLRSLLLESVGYKVSVVEYISPLETPKNIMLRAEKTNQGSRKLLEEYRSLKEALNINLTLEKLLGVD